MKQMQRGGFLMGLIVGMLAGLGLALAVALYVTKVPIPFVNKVPQRGGDRDAEEREKNRNWDPNSPLYGANPAKPTATVPAAPTTSASGVVGPSEPVAASPATTAPITPASPAPASPPVAAAASSPPRSGATLSARPAQSMPSTRDPAAILADRAPADNGEAVVSTRPRDDPFFYFVQVGAYGRSEDAEQQRAKLAMQGIESRVTEREQAGRMVYRVRLGPFDRRDTADAAKERLDAMAVEAALVRVQK